VSSEAGGRHKLLPAALAGANVIPLGRVRPFDVLPQMLLFYVVLITASVWTAKGALIIMGSEVSGKTGWAVEGLMTVGVCTFNSLEVRRPLSSWAKGCKWRVCWKCGCDFGISRLVVRGIAIRVEVEFKTL
jgi:hypothetical protein